MVVAESRCAGTGPDREKFETYAREALRDCILRGEAPIASHVLLASTGVLDDGDPGERAIGMAAGFAWTPAAELVAVYCDHGISDGMREGIRGAWELGIPVELRTLAIPANR